MKKIAAGTLDACLFFSDAEMILFLHLLTHCYTTVAFVSPQRLKLEEPAHHGVPIHLHKQVLLNNSLLQTAT